MEGLAIVGHPVLIGNAVCTIPLRSSLPDSLSPLLAWLTSSSQASAEFCLCRARLLDLDADGQGIAYKDRHVVLEAAVEASDRLTSSYLDRSSYADRSEYAGGSSYDERSSYSQIRRRPPRTPDPERLLTALSCLGYAFWQLSGAESQALNRLHSEATSFFRSDQRSKRRHLSPSLDFGYRPFGSRYSSSLNHSDNNESFIYWDDGPEAIPKAPEIGSFISALSAYSHIVGRITDFILRHAAISLASSQRLEFEGNSRIEINWYSSSQGRDLIEERHEDGHLLTILTSAGEGLEIEREGQMSPVKLGGSELLVMPGSLLTDMTAGWISPLYHQVRNHHLSPLLSITYFVNPLLDRPIGPFAINDSNRDVDIAARARANPQVCGLPQAERLLYLLKPAVSPLSS